MSVRGCAFMYWIQEPIKLPLSIPQTGNDEYLVWNAYYYYIFIYDTIILLHKLVYQNLSFLLKIRGGMFI